jgi:hypothetical protein
MQYGIVRKNRETKEKLLIWIHSPANSDIKDKKHLVESKTKAKQKAKRMNLLYGDRYTYRVIECASDD